MTTNTPPYNFDNQLALGESGAAFLDTYFARWFSIERASRDDQRQGIDRYFTTRNQKQRLGVEYKTDAAASRTGNAFIETISVDTTGKPGWVHSSKADYLFYYLPRDGVIYMLKMATIRQQLAYWEAHFPTRHVPNNGYHTVGILVPLREFERCAEAVFVATA